MPSFPGSSERKAIGAGRFETTHWSVVLQAGQGAEEALCKLCRHYWFPLYSYSRKRGHRAHDAQDLTQQFFAHLLQKRGLAEVGQSKGRFRSFLLASLKHFADNEWHKQRTIKRGGQQQFISWEAMEAAEREGIEPADLLTPEKLFDRQWALTLLERVMNRLKQECVAARKGDLFERLKERLTQDDDGKSYRETAAELKMSEGAVKVAAHRLRRRFGELVREQVERTVVNPEEVDDEIRHLFAALG